MQYQVFFRPFLIFGIIIISTICFISLGISEDRSVTINKQKIHQLTVLIKENAGEDENKLISKINKQQDQYDTATNHRTNDGVNSIRFEQPWRIIAN